MSEKQKFSMYEMGREFYDRKIADSQIAVEKATTPYEKIVAMEKLEEAQLRRYQLNRREKILK